MESITLKNFRCFHAEQTARLAPLTLLVGENSTGKTSFMAMVRAVVDLGLGFHFPNFKNEPYDLGSFDEIAHHRGGRAGRADYFEVAFEATPPAERRKDAGDRPYCFEATFEKLGTTPFPARRQYSCGDTWFEEEFREGRPYRLRVGTQRGSWERQVPDKVVDWFNRDQSSLVPVLFLLKLLKIMDSDDDDLDGSDFIPLSGTTAISSQDFELLEGLVYGLRSLEQPPFASAPVRSKPRRTYDPARATLDPEGDYVPMYLADLFFRDKKEWGVLERRLQDFGKASALFDDISIRPLGKRDTEPFQVRVRKAGGGVKGPWRNLIDVGYGVSQALPVITELLRPKGRRFFLLQQPEVHLHPRAQAALGSLFCQVAAEGRQLLVETHGDYLLDRVRMEVRDGTTNLKPDDVSILFFERSDLDVKIHSLRIDEEGNILGTPESYRSFFMEEIQRSLRI